LILNLKNWMKAGFLCNTSKTILLISIYTVVACNIDSENLPLYQETSNKFPFEQYFLLKAYPDPYPDLDAIQKGFAEAFQMAEFRSTEFSDRWTTQGPGNIGARVNTLAVHPSNENIIYAGFSNGGLWKTVNGGANWTPLFDDKAWLSIGDIVLDPKKPETIYVATGDPNISFYPMLGDGLYRSTDGGNSFTRIGLEEHRVLTRVVLHPTNPDIIFAASMGLPFERNQQRGLYRSNDGGKTWQQVLFISEQAGITDLVIDPFDSNVLYAAGWDRIRSNRESIITGPSARVYKSTDGGNTWSVIQNGLPQQDLGRIALAISQTTPGTVYVRYVGINSQLQAIFKSTNAGASWQLININGLNTALGGFGWYFGKLKLNPRNDNELYLLGVSLYRRNPADGSWKIANTPDVHVDMHDLQITSSGNMYLATDGGIYKSTDSGFTWQDIENIPTTQFYRVAYNPHKPNIYYGGAQDNGTISGNATSPDSWQRIYGGDGFLPVFHPKDSAMFFVETQNGGIAVTTDGGKKFDNATKGIEQSDRRNWDMPYLLSYHDPNVMYTGTFRVYRSPSSAAPSFAPISQDMTDGLVFHERHHNITSICESPFKKGLLYVGTSDGNVWRTEDDGANWSKISSKLPDRYVTSVKASPAFADVLYVTHSGYRDNESIPRFHRSRDRGAAWEDISKGLPNMAINDVLILPNTKDSVLFVATDAGIYASNDTGKNWQRLGSNMPFVPCFHLAINPVERTLMVGTFARSMMTYPLQQFSTGPLTKVLRTQAELSNLSLFPNPATDIIRIAWKSCMGKPGLMRIYNLEGQLILENTLQNSSNSVSIDVSYMNSGTYFVSIQFGSIIRTKRFIKH
jgi:photosystem II stability/assembly factor-like uncharacterized protein